VACLRWRFDKVKKEFVDRGYRVYMVIDGIWDRSDIEGLLRFGAEWVYYPDEIPQLVKQLQSVPSGKTIPIPTSLDLAMATGPIERSELRKRKHVNGAG
jgi:hypothetical protein